VGLDVDLHALSESVVCLRRGDRIVKDMSD
jgi:hypothetical protein